LGVLYVIVVLVSPTDFCIEVQINRFVCMISCSFVVSLHNSLVLISDMVGSALLWWCLVPFEPVVNYELIMLECSPLLTCRLVSACVVPRDLSIIALLPSFHCLYKY